MPPTYVFDTTPGTTAYQLMIDPQLALLFNPGSYTPLPREYQPIVLNIEENVDDIFIEPSITATYFAMVDLPIGGQWLITDVDDRGLYVGRVSDKVVDPRAGTVTYRFNTLMTLLSTHEPAGVLISSQDAGLGPDGTPNEVLQYLVSRWGQEVPGLSLAQPVPPLELRGASGAIRPFVLFLSVLQTERPLSIREWLERFFDVFEGYSYRLEGRKLRVIPPAYQQTEAIDLSLAAILTATSQVSDAAIINSQTVRQRPYILVGEFLKNEDGTPKQPSDLPEIAEPTYYRQGKTDNFPFPDNRKFLKNGHYAPYSYTEELFPVIPPVRVTWTAYVFAHIVSEDGSIKNKDVSDSIDMQTHVVDLGMGRYFDAVTRWVTLDASFAWVWRIFLGKNGVKATLIVPDGNITYERQMSLPWWSIIFPFSGWAASLGLYDFPMVYYGAEFHMNIQGRAWERSKTSYSATYGVHIPPTLPAGVELPPAITDKDAAVDASAMVYGRRPGAEKVLDTWTLVKTPTDGFQLSTDMGLGDDGNARQNIGEMLLDIAQHTVKERISPYEDGTLAMMRPFPVSAAEIGRLVTFGDKTGLMRLYRYTEAHTVQSSVVECEVGMRITAETERQTVTVVPPDLAEPEAYLPPGYPPDGVHTGLQPTEPLNLTQSGVFDLELGTDRFDLLRVSAAGPVRLRLYRTAEARTEDLTRPLSEWPDQRMNSLMICEFVLPVEGGGLEIDAYAVLGHLNVSTKKLYGRAEGGEVTMQIFVPRGTRL